jgi:hypothetical protein
MQLPENIEPIHYWSTKITMNPSDNTRAKQAQRLITEKYFEALKQVLEKMRDED